jgi:hypothetical protein
MKIVNHLILNYFWKEKNLLDVVLEFDGVGEIVCLTHKVRLRDVQVNKDIVGVESVVGIGNHNFFLFSILISTFQITLFLFDQF